MAKVVARTAIWMKMNFILGDHVFVCFLIVDAFIILKINPIK